MMADVDTEGMAVVPVHAATPDARLVTTAAHTGTSAAVDSARVAARVHDATCNEEQTKNSPSDSETAGGYIGIENSSGDEDDDSAFEKDASDDDSTDSDESTDTAGLPLGTSVLKHARSNSNSNSNGDDGASSAGGFKTVVVTRSPTGLDLKYQMDDEGHLRVVDTSPRGAADKAGVWVGAAITKINGAVITTLNDATLALLKDATGDQTTLVLKKCTAPLPRRDEKKFVSARGKPSVRVRRLFSTVVVTKRADGGLPFSVYDVGDAGSQSVVVTQSRQGTVVVGSRIVGVMGVNVRNAAHFLSLATEPEFTMDIVLRKRNPVPRFVKKAHVDEPLGLGVTTDGSAPTVTTCVRGLPAWNAGIRVGDQILELMNANTARLDHESIMAVLRMAGTDIQVIVQPPANPCVGPVLDPDPARSGGLEVGGLPPQQPSYGSSDGSEDEVGSGSDGDGEGDDVDAGGDGVHETGEGKNEACMRLYHFCTMMLARAEGRLFWADVRNLLCDVLVGNIPVEFFMGKTNLQQEFLNTTPQIQQDIGTVPREERGRLAEYFSSLHKPNKARGVQSDRRRSGPRLVRKNVASGLLGIGFAVDVVRQGASHALAAQPGGLSVCTVTKCMQGQSAWNADLRVGDIIVGLLDATTLSVKPEEFIPAIQCSGVASELTVLITVRHLCPRYFPFSYHISVYMR